MEKNQKWFLIIVALIILAASISPIGFFSHIFSVFTIFSNPSGNTLLTKVTPDGTTEWQVTQKGLVYPRMLPEPDGGYLIYGSTTFPDNVLPSLMVTKIRRDGNISWSLMKSPDAYYPDITILGPASYVFPINNGYTVIDGRGAVIRLDDRGNEQWHRYYYSNLRNAITTSDGGYALSGTYYYREPRTDYSSKSIGWVIRLDSGGNRIWEYQAHEFLECNSLTGLTDGTLVVACDGPRSKELVHLDDKGNVTRLNSSVPETVGVTSFEPASTVSFNATKLSEGKIRITLLQPRGSQKEITIEDSVSHNEIKQTYAILSTEDGGFLVFSSVKV
jgi:hypothetical protein